MRAACCEATVLRNEVIAPDIRLLTVVWPCLLYTSDAADEL